MRENKFARHEWQERFGNSARFWSAAALHRFVPPTTRKEKRQRTAAVQDAGARFDYAERLTNILPLRDMRALERPAYGWNEGTLRRCGHSGNNGPVVKWLNRFTTSRMAQAEELLLRGAIAGNLEGSAVGGHRVCHCRPDGSVQVGGIFQCVAGEIRGPDNLE